jgi:membrane protein
VRDVPFSAEAERAVHSPFRLGVADWSAALRSTAGEFFADDCMGLAKQVAFSSLLAFFPAVVLLVGLLGLIGSGAYGSLVHLLGTVSPKAARRAR